MLTVAEKIKILLNRNRITTAVLADRLGISRQNLSNKLSRNNFTEKDIYAIANALELDIEINFINRETGEKI